MTRKIACVWLLLGLVLASCSPVKLTQNASPTLTPLTPTQTQSQLTLANVSNCTVESGPAPTLNPTEASAESLFKPVSDADNVTGPASAAVTIIEYSDFQCPYCAALASVLDQILAAFLKM